MSERVYVSGRPVDDARLEAWGRASDGWHVLVVWRDLVELTGGIWLPATHVTMPMGGKPSVPIPRILLPEDQTAWPRPPDFDGWWAGISDAEELPRPTGIKRRDMSLKAQRERRRYT